MASIYIEMRTNIPAAIITAQAIYESGYGQNTPKDIETKKESYNLFGIKGSGTAGSVFCWTYEKNRTEKVKAAFRAYNNYSEYIYNDDNKIIYSECSDGSWEKYDYDDNLNLISYENSSGKRVKYSYNDEGYLIKKESNEGTLENYKVVIK